jgi:hypothetical protein
MPCHAMPCHTMHAIPYIHDISRCIPIVRCKIVY